MALFGLTGREDMNDTQPKCEAGTETGEKGAGTQQECFAKASSAEGGVVATRDQTEKDDLSAASTRMKRARLRTPLQQEASRQNGKKSGGPKTAAGKAFSSWSALKHGLLSKRLMQANDENAEDFAYVLAAFRQDREPVGILEETLVEKIAYEYLRMAAAAKHYCDAAKYVVNTSGPGPGNLMRYDNMINRQFYQAMHQLERLQRLRRGEAVPAPLNVQVSHDITTICDEERSGVSR